ncbi:dipeptide ABC transporter ATP-binding protein [Nocardia aurantiaca]|uniref:Dipeptide ABC transporter ATP-binding protein n=1 Tax=Nocardia aurantiaca TaxID=2675850 RepID=A0A6I3L4T0_9NOCA|nr:ABC transporter ATP-binding protein [Nocardia aurantiaca]MTE15674.1 dipeptide ABC transporter ATP-binding protein [Nocardia aurantiaca]
MNAQHPLLRISELSVYYRGHDEPSIEQVSLEVGAGEFVSVVGESGSGKSTTVHAALRLLPSSARVQAVALELDGRDISTWSDRRLSRLRGPFVGFVPQDPGTSLNPVKRVGAQVLDALRLHRRVESGPARALALAKLELAGLPARVFEQYPHELSGGMKQRVLIAIALANDPALLVADEPTSALDVTVQKHILDHLASLREELGLGILLVTHDLDVAGERSDRMIVMRDGRIIETGSTRTIFENAREEYTRSLLAAAPSAHRGRLEPSVRGPRPVPAPAEEVLLSLRAISKRFSSGVRAADSVSLDITTGSTHALVGESGAGKSTVARIAAGLTAPDGGSVVLGGDAVTSARRSRDLRRQIQFVYQNPYSSLDPRFEVERIIAEPLVNFGLVGDRAGRRERVTELLEAVALPDDLRRRKPAELSGGQRQRVAIARALAARPRVLVLDEAVSALDVSVQAQILQLLVDLQYRNGLTYLFITHDLGVVRLIADDVTVMRAGQVVESGPATQILKNPEHDYTRRLLSAVPGTPVPDEDLVRVM